MRKWFIENFGWLIALGVTGILGIGYRFLKETFSSASGIASYIRAQRKTFVDELTRERDQLKRDKAQLTIDLENMTRAKDLRDDINAQDRETIRAFRRLCDSKNLDYSSIEIHMTIPGSD
jgi:hypothetical protein